MTQRSVGSARFSPIAFEWSEIGDVKGDKEFAGDKRGESPFSEEGTISSSSAIDCHETKGLECALFLPINTRFTYNSDDRDHVSHSVSAFKISFFLRDLIYLHCQPPVDIDSQNSYERSSISNL